MTSRRRRLILFENQGRFLFLVIVSVIIMLHSWIIMAIVPVGTSLSLLCFFTPVSADNKWKATLSAARILAHGQLQTIYIVVINHA